MEEVPSSEDKPLLSQPMDGADYDSDDYSDNDEDYGDEGRVYRVIGMREGFIGLCVGRVYRVV